MDVTVLSNPVNGEYRNCLCRIVWPSGQSRVLIKEIWPAELLPSVHDQLVQSTRGGIFKLDRHPPEIHYERT